MVMNRLKKIIYTNKVSKETFWTIISKLIFIVSGLFFIIFIPKAASIEIYGSFSLILAYISMLGLLFGTSFQVSIKKEITENKFNKIAQEMFYKSLKLKMLFSFFASIFLFLFLCFVNIAVLKENFWLFILLMVSINLWGSVVIYFEAAHRLVYNAIIYFIEYFFQISLILVFFFFGNLNLQTLLISFILGYSLSFLAGFIILHNKFTSSFQGFLQNKPDLAKIILQRAFFLSLTGISYIILSKVSVVMLSFLSGVKEVGLYSIAADTTQNAIIISAPIILGVMPLFIKNNSELLFKKTIKKIALINIGLFLFFLFLSNPIVKIIYGDGFENVGLLIKFLGLFPLLAVLQSFTQEILILKDKTKKIFIFGLFAALINIVLNFLLIPLFGIYGAAIATITSYFIWFSLEYIYLTKYIKV